MPLCQLVYISEATIDFSEEMLEALLDIARKNNAAKNITGVLIYHEGSFLQVLEGESDTVESVYELITEDDRHKNTLIMHHGELLKREFSEWQMGFPRPSKEALMALPGYHDFFDDKTEMLASEGGIANNTLRDFKKGLWRLGQWLIMCL